MSLRTRTSSHGRRTPVLAVTALAGAMLVGEVLTASGASAASGGGFAQVRQCESGGNYSTNTGNGYYGAYQFDVGTWRSVGGSGLPSNASAAEQDARAATLQAQRGWSPWPVCGRGAGSAGTSSSTATSSAKSTSAKSTSKATTKAAPKAAAKKAAPKVTVKAAAPKKVAKAATTRLARPAFAASHVVVQETGTYRPEVKAWQARMAARGWTIKVDGYFGPQSSAVARAFAAEKGLKANGTLTAGVYNGAFDLKIT